MTQRIALVAVLAVIIVAPTSRADEQRTLRSPDTFAGIADPTARSAALSSKRVRCSDNPRCLNCHPDGDRPSQGDAYPHQPPVQRGDDGHGVTAMRCATCHQKANFAIPLEFRVIPNGTWRRDPWRGSTSRWSTSACS